MEQGVMSGLLPASAATSLLTQAGQLTQAGGQRMSIEEAEAVQSMEVSHVVIIIIDVTNVGDRCHGGSSLHLMRS